MATNYLHPVTVSLTTIEFKKLDVETQGVMTAATFAILDFGVIKTPSVVVNRVAGTVTYSATSFTPNSTVTFLTGKAGANAAADGGSDPDPVPEFDLSEDISGYPEVMLSGNAANDMIYPDEGATVVNPNATNVLNGAIFSFMVLKIFETPSGGGSLVGSLQACSSSVRASGLFFDDDGASGVAAEVATKSKDDAASGWNRTVDKSTNAAQEAEYKYWNIRTAENNAFEADGTTPNPLATETDSIPFANDDYVYIRYSITGNFEQGDGTGLPATAELDALETNATIAATPFSAVTAPLSFILGWKVEL
tara:strand:+ start:517 stop:1440 length:924 start_codon:yes stop_codon:yes gene_type:complete